MANRPIPKKCSVTIGSDDLVFYADPSRLSPFIGTLTPDDNDDAVQMSVAVDGHQRRRYSGGPLSSVAGHTKTRVIGGYGVKPTLPGRVAWFERKSVVAGVTTYEKRQFSFVGTVKALRAYCEDNAVGAFVLRTPDGEPVPIPDSTP